MTRRVTAPLPTGEEFAKVICAALGSPPWDHQWPGGWPESISTALIDAVFSAQDKYNTKNGRGLKPHLDHWHRQALANGTADDLLAPATQISDKDPLGWAQDFGRRQRSPGSRKLKSETVLLAAQALLARDPRIVSARDVNPENVQSVQATLQEVPGIGFVTASYFTMLPGYEGVKPDTMVHRFVNKRVGHNSSSAAVAQLLAETAQALGVRQVDLDHEIWRFTREPS